MLISNRPNPIDSDDQAQEVLNLLHKITLESHIAQEKIKHYAGEIKVDEWLQILQVVHDELLTFNHSQPPLPKETERF